MKKELLSILSNNLSKQIVKSNGKEDLVDIYRYAIELMISTIIGFAAILCISAFTMGCKYGVIFILFFSPLRAVVGGYHASSYFKCFIMTCCSYVCLSVAFLILCKYSNLCEILLSNLIPIVIYVIWKAPILNVNQPLSERRIQQNRLISRIIIIFECLLITIFVKYQIYLALMAVLSVDLVVVLMLFTELHGKE